MAKKKTRGAKESLFTGKKKARKPKKKKPETLAAERNIFKNPNVLNDSVLLNPKVVKRAIGLDFGTKTGFAYLEYLPKKLPKYQRPIYMGQFDLQVGEWETTAMKFLRLRQFLNVILPDVIFFEDVKQAVTPSKAYMMGGIIKSVEMLGAMKAVTCLWAEEHEVPAHGFGIGQIKKYATGRGVASKEVMIEACNRRFGTKHDPTTYETTGVDNAVDAAFALVMGMEAYCEGLQ
jgi:Holliday junction resolvasome RuvABC endonuclease subunit